MKNTNNIIKYNDLIEDIVQKFATRFLTEFNGEETIADKSDYFIMNYCGINQLPVEILDMYLSIDDILIAEMYNIPADIINDRRNYSYDMHEKENPINLYNYFRKYEKM